MSNDVPSSADRGSGFSAGLGDNLTEARKSLNRRRIDLCVILIAAAAFFAGLFGVLGHPLDLLLAGGGWALSCLLPLSKRGA